MFLLEGPVKAHAIQERRLLQLMPVLGQEPAVMQRVATPQAVHILAMIANAPMRSLL